MMKQSTIKNTICSKFVNLKDYICYFLFYAFVVKVNILRSERFVKK